MRRAFLTQKLALSLYLLILNFREADIGHRVLWVEGSVLHRVSTVSLPGWPGPLAHRCFWHVFRLPRYLCR